MRLFITIYILPRTIKYTGFWTSHQEFLSASKILLTLSEKRQILRCATTAITMDWICCLLWLNEVSIIKIHPSHMLPSNTASGHCDGKVKKQQQKKTTTNLPFCLQLQVSATFLPSKTSIIMEWTKFCSQLTKITSLRCATDLHSGVPPLTHVFCCWVVK